MARPKPSVWAETQQDKLQSLLDRVEEGTRAVFDDEQYKRYLTVMSRFHNYSFRNSLLILLQQPDASHIAGYRAWQALNRQVRKGEEGIRIFAPCPINKTVETRVFAPDGTVSTETQEVTIPKFRAVAVFDISQTDGDPLPTYGVGELTGGVAGYTGLLEALRRISPVPVTFEDIASGAKGYYSREEQRIAVQRNMGETQTVKTVLHEIAHADLHHPDSAIEADRRTREVQAESCAFVVCAHYGIDTSDYSFPYLAGWSSGKELKELQGSLAHIQKETSALIGRIDAALEKIKQMEHSAEMATYQEYALSPSQQDAEDELEL